MSVFHLRLYLFPRFRIAIAAAFLLCTGWCHADTYIVGTGSGCTHNSIQGAIASAESNPANDTIRITRSLAYTAQALVISTSQVLDITGGFANCAQAAGDGNQTLVSGAGGSTEPVFRITANTGGIVNVRYLKITGGDEDGEGYGGGIYFRGNGILELNDSLITANTAGYGGGIYAQGTAINAELIIGSNVQITSNTARYSGGGVYVEGLEMTMVAPGSYMAFNHAPGVFNTQTNRYDGGYAGGLMVLSGSLPAYAYVGSSSVGTLGPIYGNDARYGGGVAVVSYESDAELRLFTTDPASPVRIKSNSAVVAGGGIYETRNSSLGLAMVRLWYANIEFNLAPHGGAVYMENSSYLYFNRDAVPPGAVPCPLDRPCGEISDNYAEDNSLSATGGVIEVKRAGSPIFNRMSITRNKGKNVFRGDANGEEFSTVGMETHHVLIARNVVSEQLIATIDEGDDSGYFDLHDTTISGNIIGALSVLRISNTCSDPTVCGTLYRTIIWQPGKTTLEFTGGYPFSYLSDIVSEVGSLTGSGPYAIVQDPRFVDPDRGDFSLRAASPAIDKAQSVANDPLDLFSRPRDIDLFGVDNVGMGLRDIGAIERQSIQPLVLNSDFDADLNLWSPVIAGVTTRDSTINISGAPGSGSAKVFQTNAPFSQKIPGISQCVHLPGPGTYAVNGWGRSTGNGIILDDSAALYWEYRRDGSETCIQGAPVSSGYVTLSASSSWRRPPIPVLISVSPEEWTHNSSITVTLVAVENSAASNTSTSAWFDGVTIQLIGADTIFADGFEGASTN